ncbi:hypothetical protein Fcan01_16946 [Folsomia candida]|uniref:Uncharacterized protein n=1 Tax=Folsomia candida TaxID=158441 RepID=A0A226DT04_FOLCA|nr:hypothetical protein Fcan01_16946 [Folsomia candida]
MLVLNKVYHYPLSTLSTLLIFAISMVVILANYFALRMNEVIPAIVLYVAIPTFLVSALWLPSHVLPDCGEVHTISMGLIRKWRLRGRRIWGGGKKKEFDKVVRSLPPSYLKFGLGQYVLVKVTRATKGLYHKAIVDYTISAVLFSYFSFTEYSTYPRKTGSYPSILLIFQLTDIFLTISIFLFTPVAMLLKWDPYHHLFLHFLPHYATHFSLQVWIGVTFRLPFCIIMLLDFVRSFVYVALVYVVGCKIWLRHFHLIEEPYRVIRFLVARKKLLDSMTTYREILVLQKVFHYPLMTLSTLLVLIISVVVILANYFALRMHDLIPGIVLYVGIPAFLIAALWLPYQVLPDCGDVHTTSVELIRRWRLRGGWIRGDGRKEFDKVLRSLPPSCFKFGVGQFVFVKITGATKGLYHRAIVDYTISAVLFKWKV